jgi:phosphoribosylaminoimidazolecarboxamide formyltransferase/IMP cyclohydrolase
MAQVISSIEGDQTDKCVIKRALLSVSDKTNLVELASFLASKGVELLSTGGTAAAIRKAGLACRDVSDYTGFPEIMDGRVKTLHPKVHGGIMNMRGNADHMASMAEHGISSIDLVVLNLYAFGATVAKGSNFETCIENIDIGGPSMLRSSAKNHAYVTIATSPDQYETLMAEMSANAGTTTMKLRRSFAARAFALSAQYDSTIASWMVEQLNDASFSAAVTAEDAALLLPPPVTTRVYEHERILKYGCNPSQKPASILRILGQAPPFHVLNGNPGYINLLDALNAYSLVRELRASLDLPAAASFKHVSPAGAAVATPLSEEEMAAYEVHDPALLTPLALAYLRARQADPLCSFGDFSAVSDVVDVATATYLKAQVSDGIIAPGYEPEALAILSSKKSGGFIVLQANAGSFEVGGSHGSNTVEYRELHGCVFSQKRNTDLVSLATVSNFVTAIGAEGGDVPESALRDLVLASIAIKYTQSNSVAYARNGQITGVGAGQQSRVDCVKLAGRKVSTWYLRQHPKVIGLPFKDGSKKQDRVNARVRYIEGGITPSEKASWLANFSKEPEPLTDAEKAEFLATLDGVALSSDAFFTFRDSLDHASRYGVRYVAQTGGSKGDSAVIAAANEYGMAMCMTGIRLFHH